MQKCFAEGSGLVYQDVLSWLQSSNIQLQLSGALAIANFARNGELYVIKDACEIKHVLQQVQPPSFTFRSERMETPMFEVKKATYEMFINSNMLSCLLRKLFAPSSLGTGFMFLKSRGCVYHSNASPILETDLLLLFFVCLSFCQTVTV